MNFWIYLNTCIFIYVFIYNFIILNTQNNSQNYIKNEINLQRYIYIVLFYINTGFLLEINNIRKFSDSEKNIHVLWMLKMPRMKYMFSKFGNLQFVIYLQRLRCFKRTLNLFCDPFQVKWNREQQLIKILKSKNYLWFFFSFLMVKIHSMKTIKIIQADILRYDKI